MIFKSLTTRVIGLSVTLLACGITAFAYLNFTREQDQLVDFARQNTSLLLNTIESSIYNSMRIGNTADVQTILEMVGRNPQLLGVRIFHPHGTILKSSIPTEMGRTADRKDYALFTSGKTEAIYPDIQDGVLTMIKPIYNLEECHICHGHKIRVIGLLNINYSLAETQKRMVEATQLFVASTTAIILFLSGAIALVMLKFIRTPLSRMVSKMALIEAGDLTVRMRPKGGDEIGRLMASFNSMVQKLDTAKRELEQYHFQQMERADRLASMGEMAAGIAHEIKNPLTGIAAAITIIKDDFEAGDPRTEIIAEVLEQIKRLDKTVNDLLFFGKPTMPEMTYSDLNAILNKTLLFAAQHRGGRNITRELDLQKDLPPVYVDPKQIQQVFLNLILNAVQAMQEQGVLTITSSLVERDGKAWARVGIGDTGPGIPQQILGKIFTPFFTTKAQGTGLGLAICHKLILQHHGTIDVVSEDGKGTTFIIELPISGDAFAPPFPTITV